MVVRERRELVEDLDLFCDCGVPTPRSQRLGESVACCLRIRLVTFIMLPRALRPVADYVRQQVSTGSKRAELMRRTRQLTPSMLLHNHRCGYFRVGGFIFAAMRVGGQLLRFLVQLLDLSLLEASQYTVHLTPADAVAREVELFVDQLARFYRSAARVARCPSLCPVGIPVLRQQQRSAFHGAPYCGKARRVYRSIDGQQEAEGAGWLPGRRARSKRSARCSRSFP